MERVADFACPVFILHGDRDRHTLPEAARAFVEKAREPKSLWLVPGAAHVDLYGFAKTDYEKHLLGFIASATTHGTAASP